MVRRRRDRRRAERRNNKRRRRPQVARSQNPAGLQTLETLETRALQRQQWETTSKSAAHDHTDTAVAFHRFPPKAPVYLPLIIYQPCYFVALSKHAIRPTEAAPTESHIHLRNEIKRDHQRLGDYLQRKAETQSLVTRGGFRTQAPGVPPHGHGSPRLT